MTDTKTDFRAVVIGYGFAGRSFHSYLISLTPGLSLHGVMSRDAATRQKIAAERGCRAYADFDAVLSDPDVDLVVLATPSSTHAPLAIAALGAGKNVVTDKVMCLNLTECDAMMDAAKQSGKLLTVFQNRRWDGDFLTVKQAMTDGTLGDVRWLEMAWMGFGAWGGWRGRAEMGGGRFYDLGAHLIDQMAVLFPGSIESVYCRMRRDFPETNTDSEALIIVTFEGGATGICDLSSLSAWSKPRFLAHGSKATLAKWGLDPQENAMKAGDIDAAREDPQTYAKLSTSGGETILPTLPGRWRSFYENVAETLAGRAEIEVTLPQARRVMTILDAALRSAATGEVVRVR